MRAAVGTRTREAVYPACDGAFVGEKTGDPAFVLGPRSTDKCGVIDEAILRAISERNVLEVKRTLGVLPFVFSARKSAFSAPRICTVDAGYLARFVKDPLVDDQRCVSEKRITYA